MTHYVSVVSETWMDLMETSLCRLWGFNPIAFRVRFCSPLVLCVHLREERSLRLIVMMNGCLHGYPLRVWACPVTSRRRFWPAGHRSWPRPACCRANASTAASGSSTRSSTAFRRKPATSVPREPQSRSTPSAERGRAARGGSCWSAVLEAGRLLCVRSYCGPVRFTASTEACTSTVWASTSAGPRTRTRCAWAASSAAWCLRYAARDSCQNTRRKWESRRSRAHCSRESARETQLRRSRGEQHSFGIQRSRSLIYCFRWGGVVVKAQRFKA